MICLQAWKDWPNIVISNCWGRARAGWARNEIGAVLIHVACVLQQLDLKYCTARGCRGYTSTLGFSQTSMNSLCGSLGTFSPFLEATHVFTFLIQIHLDSRCSGHRTRRAWKFRILPSMIPRSWWGGKKENHSCRQISMCSQMILPIKCFVERCQFMRLRWYCVI